MPSYLLRSAIAALACAAASAFAQPSPITISGAWVRATVPGQGGTGAFMTLQSPQALELVGASTPVAGVAQVHAMKLEGNTMHMQHLPALALPAHQSVTLTPGGNHIMLMDLTAPLAAGDETTFTLTFSDDSTYEFTAPVKDYSGANENYEGGDMDMDMTPTPTPSN